jgi:hypothetical protein
MYGEDNNKDLTDSLSEKKDGKETEGEGRERSLGENDPDREGDIGMYATFFFIEWLAICCTWYRCISVVSMVKWRKACTGENMCAQPLVYLVCEVIYS